MEKSSHFSFSVSCCSFIIVVVVVFDVAVFIFSPLQRCVGSLNVGRECARQRWRERERAQSHIDDKKKTNDKFGSLILAVANTDSPFSISSFGSFALQMCHSQSIFSVPKRLKSVFWARIWLKNRAARKDNHLCTPLPYPAFYSCFYHFSPHKAALNQL